MMVAKLSWPKEMLEELQWEGLEVEALGQVAGSSGIPWGQQQALALKFILIPTISLIIFLMYKEPWFP